MVVSSATWASLDFSFGRVSCYFGTLSFSSLFCLAFSDGYFQCKDLLLQEILDHITVDDSFSDLVTCVLLHEEIVKHLAGLLCSSSEVSAFH